jgi:hypothetical protein
MMLWDSFGYIKAGVIDNIKTWSLLIIATFIFTIPLWGYLLKILRNEKPAPEIVGWISLFIDGFKVIFIALVYAIPIGMANFFLNPAAPTGMLTENSSILESAGLFSLVLILAFFIGLVEIIGIIRFARTDRMSEAFNFNGILGEIRRFGWIEYIFAIVILGLVVSIVIGIPMTIMTILLLAVFVTLFSYLGILYVQPILFVISLVITPLIAVFVARYLVQVFDAELV